ncbi:hypothetical protein BRCON_2016 [Candidatus Sumerlaea chitinivorans]|uniref:Uncharacterized protein n=1 Tax=Sumerlaea chitinivorans TaxID=2250252 RepID=A0A2Z4Y8M2_SUMC1|nr:hypothetical protein BRCON_2016 [Candidatus Sumerlaea chitinivorans]
MSAPTHPLFSQLNKNVSRLFRNRTVSVLALRKYVKDKMQRLGTI